MFSGISQNGAETFRFRNLEAITDKEVEKLLLEISSKVLKLLKQHAYINQEGEMVNYPLSDSLFRDHESLAMATSSSIVGRIALRHLKVFPFFFSEYWLSPKILFLVSYIPLCLNRQDRYRWKDQTTAVKTIV